MLVIISPAKSLDYATPLATTHYTKPELLDYSQTIISKCQELIPAQIAQLMKVSDELAGLNYSRFQTWQPNFTPDNARQAVLAFKGTVYHGLHAQDFSEEDFDFAQKHLRILSGLYGVLRPLDLIMPYRLEMGVKLHGTWGKNLYSFWHQVITKKLNETLKQQKDNIIINLASDEYFKAVKTENLAGEIIQPIFLDEKNGKYKVISFHAKKARGLMSRFIIKNRLHSPEQLSEFNLAGYFFDKAASRANELIFIRPEQ